MFVLINCADRELICIGKYDTIDEARIDMHRDIILAMNETNCDSDWIDEVRDVVNGQQFNDSFYYHDEEMEIDGWSAWGNLHGEYHFDWKIFEI